MKSIKYFVTKLALRMTICNHKRKMVLTRSTTCPCSAGHPCLEPCPVTFNELLINSRNFHIYQKMVCFDFQFLLFLFPFLYESRLDELADACRRNKRLTFKEPKVSIISALSWFLINQILQSFNIFFSSCFFTPIFEI